MLSNMASPARVPTAFSNKEVGKCGAEKADKMHCGDSQQQPDERTREMRLDDLPCELVWMIASHVDLADVIAMASVNSHIAVSVDGPLRARAIDQRTLLRRLRLFVLCVSHALAARHASAIRFLRPFVAGDLVPRECVMATARGHLVHWVWMTTRGDSICYGKWHCAVDLGYNDARLLALYQHMETDGVNCIVTSDKESPGEKSAIGRAFWSATVGSCPPPPFDGAMQKGLGSCDRLAPAADVWTRWSANPAAAEAFVREAALCPLSKETALS
ncbi:hypothetical protein pmac_cds_396 [Pandoravirus macleodensis]|uniref:F-box domain containing protein n=1 Tax=Pandoravirus macleodensis TaxID=2107707 RepID=A0A2U7UF69_9VIRU|nr:hypothetical protein pmac_cds_396 [Pandoravirus macleodensis]AVK77084.1 hypothetical protein pmac_cds_396 [Pandoravirus macleodensis]